jgi:hypothetical protein
LRTIGGQFLLKGNGYVMNLDALTSLRRINKTVTLMNNGNLRMTIPPGVAVGPDGKVDVSAQPQDAQPGMRACFLEHEFIGLLRYRVRKPVCTHTLLCALHCRRR